MFDEKEYQEAIEGAKRLREKVKHHIQIGLDRLIELEDGAIDFDTIVKLHAAYGLCDKLNSDISKMESDLFWHKNKDILFAPKEEESATE